ncbi:MAG: cytochrome P460 family protein [Leptospirales bacterium]|nr:cytochrome P460 family protein [Leptospirales bacterium]
MRILLCLLALAGFLNCTKKEPGVPYPEGYKKWSLLKSALITKGEPLFEPFGGIHHIYGNSDAVAAIEAGKPAPEGAVLVFDLYEAVSSDSGDAEGAHKFVAVMIKDTEQFKSTGGWGYDAFKGDTRERFVKNAATECFACHQSQERNDFVFTTAQK